MGKAKRETPLEAFETLRQAFDTLKSNHTDPWCWHEYLQEEPKQVEPEDEDPELFQLKPKPRSNLERLKSHLLSCISELNRSAQAADTAYFHMCCSPQMMKQCVLVLGTSGDIDADLLGSDASPQKIMARLQEKLNEAHEQIVLLETEIAMLKEKIADARAESKDRWFRWQNAAMLAEDSLMKLNNTTIAFQQAVQREDLLKAAYRDLHLRLIRASRLMLFKGRQMLRDQVFKVNKKENLFYAFNGFVYILQQEKAERIRKEHEAQRDRVEFALRNEVKFLLAEGERTVGSVRQLVMEAGRLKQDRRALACRLMHKNRPYEPLEYCLWVWELWQPLRPILALEKALETEAASRDAVIQQLVQTTRQLPIMAHRIDELQEDIVAEQIAHDVSKRELTAAGARQFSALVERLRTHRMQELAVMHRIHEVDVADKVERIAVLEREIAEDKHIHALKGMVVDLECNLRKALDRRKQRAFVVPPNTGSKCPQCARENLFRAWRGMQEGAAEADLGPLLAEAAPPPPVLRPTASLGSLPTSKGLSPRLMLPLERAPPKLVALPADKRASFSAVWR